RAIALDPQGRRLAIGTQPPQVQVFDTTTGAKVAEFAPEGWFPFGGDVRTLQFDHGGGRLIGTTGDAGSVQVWNTQDWSLVWWHDYGGGNPGALQTAVDAQDQVLGVWGMTLETPRLFALADGDVLANLAGTGLEDLAPVLGATLASRRGSLIALDGSGQVEFEWLDVGDHGAGRFDGESLSGPPAALRQVFVRTKDGLVRGDAYEDD
ncbi:MAG: WD40 repeat domain-containing protein, partial [Planctomycetota bacterium]|nr:WD40 repeat domain-containing protein [Planctomycetota bacterium]